ncbi:reverse transcriptase family protein [Photobacterium leiognathi]|uniref:reverse transcriptase family protein n=1 Tax=Photobacterium leiognathi TaxID=553611 RepID=UPI002982A97F|nr:reverse transcriptase family protein [Photobacterium leiognathi]
MKKIDKVTFIDKIAATYNRYDPKLGVPIIDPAMVIEFKIGKKFVYRLNNNHIDCEGLKKTQEKLVSDFLSLIPLNSVAKAYVSETSYLDFLEPHRNNYFFVRTDLKNFFHTISINNLKDNFNSYFENDYSSENKKQLLIDAFINMVAFKVPENSDNKKFSGNVILPMGFKTSPVISNIILRKIDNLIEDYCSRYNIVYTRYADDMLFSSKINSEPFDNPFTKIFNPNAKPKGIFIHSARFMDEISFIVNIDGFKINKKKTIKRTNIISINGYTIEGSNYSDIQGTIRISNKKTNIIEKLIYEIEKGKSCKYIMMKLFDFKVSKRFFKYHPVKDEHVERYCKDQLNNKIIGYRSYLISILKYNCKYNCIDNNSIKKYTRLIKLLNKMI